MTILTLTESELRAGHLSDAHLQTAVTAIREEGFVVLLGAVSQHSLDTVRDKMLEDVERFVKRQNASFNWNKGNIQQDPPPFPPYLFADILMNPFAVDVTRAILGPGVKNAFYSGNTALQSQSRQPVHGDTGQLWNDLQVAPPAAQLVVNIMMVDVSPANGATELWPGTHLDLSIGAHRDIKIAPDALEARRAVSPPFQPTLPAGAILIRDIRLWHAGMPNQTPDPRPMIAMIHSASWYEVGTPLQFPVETREFFQNSPLKQCAQWVEGDIDYIAAPSAYEYNASATP